MKGGIYSVAPRGQQEDSAGLRPPSAATILALNLRADDRPSTRRAQGPILPTGQFEHVGSIFPNGRDDLPRIGDHVEEPHPEFLRTREEILVFRFVHNDTDTQVPSVSRRSDTTDSRRFDVRRNADRLCHEGSGGTAGPGRAFGITSPPGRPARLSIGIPAVYREGKARITGWGRRSGVLGMRAGPSFSAGSGRPAPARAFRVSVADLTSRSEARNSGRRSFDRGGALLPSERDATLRTARSGSRR